jgi:rare lipoprotein A (peptidoglycan hydrolase)
LESRKPNKPIKKWGTELNKKFSTEENQMAEKHLKKCSTALTIREMQIKTTLRFHLIPVRMTKIRVTANAGEDVEKEEHSSIAVGTASWYNHSGNQFGGSSENLA